MTPTFGTLAFSLAWLGTVAVLLFATLDPSDCVTERVSHCVEQGFHTDTEVELCESFAEFRCGGSK